MEKNFGEYIQKERKKQKLTIRKLAERSGLSHSSISMIERNIRQHPKSDTIQKLARGLKIPYQQLLVKAGYMKESASLLIINLESVLECKCLQFEGSELNKKQREFLEIFLCTLVNQDFSNKQLKRYVKFSHC